MRNRAKCKLCGDILESYYQKDYVECSCGEIAINGGNYELKCFAKNWENFLRLDDAGNVMSPKIVEKESEEPKEKWEEETLNREVRLKILFDSLDQMQKATETLPQHVMTSPATQYDFAGLVILMKAIVKEML